MENKNNDAMDLEESNNQKNNNQTQHQKPIIRLDRIGNVAKF